MKATREIKFKALTQEDEIIKSVGSIEFFEDGTIIVNDEIPVKALIQFIGLKDENGIDVYEGDIVKGSKFIGIVTYREGAYHVLENRTKTGVYSLCNINLKYEVIGSIYEKILNN